MKKKWLTIGISAVVAVIIIFLLIRSGSSSPSQLVDSFKEAVKNGDAKGLMDLVTADEDVIWNEKHAESTIKYLQEETSDYKEQIMLLNAQAAYYESDGQANNILSQKYPGESIIDVGPFYITEEDGFWGNDYILRSRGYHLSVDAPDGTTIIFNGENVDMEDEETKVLGVFAPGVYTIKGKKEYDYATVTDETAVTLFDIDDFEETAKLDLSGEMISVHSNTPNTAIFVNDNQSEVTIDQKTHFGPVEEGITLKGVKEFPWGIGESDSITISGDGGSETYNLTPKPVTSDKVKDSIKTIINEFAQSRITALVEQDSKLLINVSDNISKDYTKWISSFDDRHYVKGKALGTRMDFSNVIYELGNGDAELIHIPVEFHDDFVEVFRISRNKDLEERFQEKIVTLEYIGNNTWVVINVVNDPNRFDDNYMTSDEVVKTSFQR